MECIIVDDGSSDNTNQIVNSIDDYRLVYIRHPVNKGASASRNTGMKYSRGDFIAFLDDDDEWMIDKLEKQVELLKKSKQDIGLIYSWMSYMKGEKELYLYNPKLKGYIFKDMLDKQAIGNSSTLLVRRQVIEKIGGFDESLPRGNDGDFIRRVCRKYEVDFLPEVLVKIHIDHGMPRISDDTKKSVQDVIKSLKIRFEKFSDDQENYPKEFASICLFIAYHYATIRELKESIFWSLKAVTFSPLSVFVYKRIIHLLMEAYNYSIK